MYFRYLITFSNSLYGDGAVHTYLAKQMVNNRLVYSHFPHWIVEVTNGNYAYFPVAYPQLDYFILAFSYFVLGENGVKSSNVLFGTLSVLMVFLFVEKIANKKVALIATVFILFEEVLYSNMVAFYMESALTFFSLAVLFCYVKFLQQRRNRDLWLVLLFLGLSIAAKQQGLLVYLGIVSFHFVSVIWAMKKKMPRENEAKLQTLLKLIVLPLLFASPFVVYQLTTTGTLFYPPVPEFSRIFFQPKWVEDPIAFKYIENLVTPTVWTSGWLIESALWFASFYPGLFCLLGFVLLLIGMMWIFMKQRRIATLLSFIVVTYAVVFIWVNPLPRYYLILRILANVVAGIGAYNVIDTLLHANMMDSIIRKSTHRTPIKWLKQFIVATLLLFLVISPALLRAIGIYDEYYKISDKTSGGRWPDRVAKIAEAAEWLKPRISESDIILIGRLDEALFYLERNVMWITALGGRDIPKIFSSMTASEAWNYLQRYNVSYIWIDQLQHSSNHVEKIPKHGLVDFVDISPFFIKVYQNDFVRIYRVTSWFEKSTNLSQRHYYSNLFGDYDDVYETSPITLAPSNRWQLKPAFRAGISGNRSYAEIKVISDEFNVDNEFSKVPVTFALYYYDSFTGSVEISVLNFSTPSTFAKLTTLSGTSTGLLKGQIIQVAKTYIHESKVVLAFDVHGEPFPLRAILFFPGYLIPLEETELDEMIASLPFVATL